MTVRLSERERLDLLAAGDGDPNWRGASMARTEQERRILHLFRQLPEAKKIAFAEWVLARMKAIKPPH